MRRKNKKVASAAAAAIAVFVGGQTQLARAGNGTWTSLAGGPWNTAGNWSGTNIADGSGAIADFSTLNIIANATVTLDNTNRSAGTLKFGDTTASNDWFLSSSGGAVLTLDNGASSPLITLVNRNLTINAALAGTNGFTLNASTSVNVTLNDASTGLLGTVNVLRGLITVQNNNAFGTGTIIENPGTNTARIVLATGVNLANNLTLNSVNPVTGFGAIQSSGGATFSGTLTINATPTSGGHIVGPTNVASGTPNFLSFTGQIIDNLPAVYASSGGGNSIAIRQGNTLLSGGGSYYRIDNRNGIMQVGANNGIATNAFVDEGANVNGTIVESRLDLNGFNQQLVGVSNFLPNVAAVCTVTNNSVTGPSVLTLTPNPTSYLVPDITNGNILTNALQNLKFSGTINDNSAAVPAATLSIVINSALNPNSGDSTGIQTFSNTSNTYTGTTTITSGTLAVTGLANGGSSSSIGSSSSAATNLILDGGGLQYIGTSTSTDRNFTVTAAKTGTINVSTAGVILTMSGGSAATTGSLIKAGAGTLLLSGANLHTGNTSVSAGTLLVNGSLTAASAVSISNLAILGGSGTVGGTVTPASGGIMAPGDPSVSTGVGTLTVGGLTLNSGSVVNFELTAGSNDQITVSNPGGLAINAAGFDLYQPGNTTSFSTNGTYTLFNINGGFSGALTNISISNPAAGKVYSLASSTSAVQITIADATTREWNNNSASTNWVDGGNWIGGNVPNGLGQTALFASNLVGVNGAVNLTAAETVSGLIFNNSSVSYSVNQGGGGSLILDNGVAAAAIDVISGSHSINVPIVLHGATALDTTNSTDVMTIGGNITGAKPVTINGPGAVTLSGAANTFTTIAVNGGTLNVGGGTSGSLGSGAVSLTGGASLNFNTNTNYNFGQPITGSAGFGNISQLGAGTTTVGAITGVTTVNSSAGTLVVIGGISQSAGVNVTGSGSLNVSSGGITGAGPLSVNTTGVVSLTGISTYTGKTTLTAGSLRLAASSSLPNSAVLEVDGGVLDLRGNNLSVSSFQDLSSSTGVITNNAASSTTSTVTFSGFGASSDIYAALNDGPAGGKIAISTNIGSTVTSASYFLRSHTSSNFSGGTVISAESIEADATNAFGVGPISILLNNTTTNNSFIQVAGGITLPNNINIAQGNSNPLNSTDGLINYLRSGNSGSLSGSTTLTGTITIQADSFTGTTFSGPTAAADVLNINGPVICAGTATTISVRAGNVGFGGGGSYPNLNVTGTAIVNATNGIATNAFVRFNNGTLDLRGFNQTIAGLGVNGGTATATNTNSSNAALTINNTVADSYNATISGSLSLVKTGAANLLLNGTSTYSGSTSINAGSLTVGSTTALPATTNLSIGTLSTPATVTVSQLASAYALQVNGLSISGNTGAWNGKLDLVNNDLDIHTGSLATLSNQIKQGFNAAGASWQGSAGITSSTAAADTTLLTALGAIVNDDGAGNALYGAGAPVSTFGNVTPIDGDLLVKYTYYGDADLSGAVDGSDYSRIDNAFLNNRNTSNIALTGWYNGDFNYDGLINGSDYTLIDNAFNSQGSQIAAQIAVPTAQIASGPGTSAVPEPASFGLLGIGVLGLLGRRRHR